MVTGSIERYRRVLLSTILSSDFDSPAPGTWVLSLRGKRIHGRGWTSDDNELGETHLLSSGDISVYVCATSVTHEYFHICEALLGGSAFSHPLSLMISESEPEQTDLIRVAISEYGAGVTGALLPEEIMIILAFLTFITIQSDEAQFR